MRLWCALRLSRALRMPQVTMPLMAMMIVAANTSQPPHCTCGTNSRISTRKARRLSKKVGSMRIIRISKYRGEWAGECKCAATAIIKRMSVARAAIGWTMSREESERRVLAGRVKSILASLSIWPSGDILLARNDIASSIWGDSDEQECLAHSSSINPSAPQMNDLPGLYPIRTPLHVEPLQ